MTPEQENGHRLLVAVCDVAASGRQTLRPSVMAEVRDQLRQLKADRDVLLSALCEIAAMPPSGAFHCGQIARDAIDRMEPKG